MWCGIIISVLLSRYAVPFEVTRELIKTDQGFETVNRFTNEFVVFTGCWPKNANCNWDVRCVQCECSEGSTFFSKKTGCMTAYGIKEETHKSGQQCDFFTRKFSYKYIPLFDEPLSFRDVGLSLIDHDPYKGQVCNAGPIYIFDYYGTEVLFDFNKCEGLLRVAQITSEVIIEWNSNNSTLAQWERMRGQLLSVQVDCKSPVRNFTSCFLFQVAGKHVKEKEWPEPVSVPQNCTVVPAATPPSNLDIKQIKALPAPITTIATVTSVVLLLLLVSVVFYLLFRRKRRKERELNSSVHAQFITPTCKEPTDDYAVPDVTLCLGSAKNEYLQPTVVSCTPTPSKKAPFVYASIDQHEHNGGETRARNTSDASAKWMSTLEKTNSNGTLKNRPLPDRPMDIANPYYAPSRDVTSDPLYASSGAIDSQNRNTVGVHPTTDSPVFNTDADKESEPNDLYTLYSTIADMKTCDEGDI